MRYLTIAGGIVAIFLFVIFGTCLLGCGGKVDSKFAPKTKIEKWNNDEFATVLSKVVTADGFVKHELLEKNQDGVRDALFRYVGAINAAGPENRPELFPSERDKLAYYCNAYNAVCMYQVVKRGFPANMKTSGIFILDSVPVGGKSMTLDYLEKTYLRPFDARIHFAINCMSASCPPLRNEPYEAAKLDAQFNEQGRIFMTDPRGVVKQGDKVLISAIFKFFPEDFLRDYEKSTGKKAGNVLEAIQIYAPENSPVHGAKSFDFQEYDWSLNRPQ